jgi:hypothetical protein
VKRRLLPLILPALLAAGSPDLAPPPSQAGLRDAPISGDRLSGFVLPIVPVKGDLSIRATRAFRWKVDDTQRLAIDGDVRMTIGGYNFGAASAVVWINRIPSAEGVITQMAAWFPEVTEPTRGAGLGVEGRNVLVTASFRGQVKLATPVVEDRAPGAVVTGPADARLAEHLRSISAGPASMRVQPQVDRPVPPKEPDLQVQQASTAAAPSTPAAPATPDAVQLPAPGTPAFRKGDVVTFAGRETHLDEKQDLVTVTGGAQVDIMARDPSLKSGEMRLAAERAVIFLRPGSARGIREGAGQLDAGVVEGVYLEGDVTATDGAYAMRGGQVYYDVTTGRAAALQAVLRTSMRSGIPVIARAAEVRQVAKDQFEARDASVSLSEFYRPHLSVGASRVTISKGPADDSTTTLEASHITMRAGSVPFFYWPYLRGDADRPLLPQVQVGFNEYQGVTVGTRWDLWQLVGWKPPFDMGAELGNDIYSRNGIGLGLRLTGTPGDLNLYGFYDFQNTEQSSSGLEYVSPLQWRGLIDGGTTVALDRTSLLQGQLAWTSDGAFVSTFKPIDFMNRREYETSGFVKLQSSHTAFDTLVKYDLDRYVINSWMLASRPYSVAKYPEATYRRYGDSLFDGSFTWTQEYSANGMSMQLERGTPNGLTDPLAAQADAFATGINANSSIGNLYTSQGYNEETYIRGYTRHELAAPLDWDMVKVTPFASGSLIGYMLNDFQDYRTATVGPGGPGGVARGVFGGGARASAEFSQEFGQVQSSTLDLNRLRWVLQPNAVLWGGYDTGDNGQYPIFDQDVEGQTGAAVAQVGLTQRWQTYRGGPGNWRSVDWIMLDFGAVVNNDDANFQRPANGLGNVAYYQSPTPQFFTWRPELSQWGNHAYARSTWALSSTLTAYGSTTLLFEDRNTAQNAGQDNFARGSVGLNLQHSPDVAFFCEYRMINNFYNSAIYPNDELLQPGVTYQIGKLYSLSASPQIDLGQGDLRALSASLVRTFPDFNLGANIGYSVITDQYSFGLQFSIPAAGGKGLGTGNLNATDQGAMGGPWSGLNNAF